MDTPLDDSEMVEDARAGLLSTLGDAQSKLDSAAKLAEKLIQRLVAQHEGTVQALKGELQTAREDLKLAQTRCLNEKEALLAEAASGRQILVEEQRCLFQEKESLQRQLADLRATREVEQQRTEEKLLALERQHQEERQRSTEAWDAEKADLSKKLKHAAKVNHALKRQNQAQLEVGVTQKLQSQGASQKDLRTQRCGSASGNLVSVGLIRRTERSTPDQETSPLFPSAGSPASTLPTQASSNLGERQTTTPPVRVEAATDAASQREQQAPGSGSGEKRPRIDGPEGASQAPGKEQTVLGLAKKQLEGPASKETEVATGLESTIPSPKRRKQLNGSSVAVPSEVGTKAAQGTLDSLETLDMLPEVGQGVEGACRKEVPEERACISEAQRGKDTPACKASLRPKEKVLSCKVGPLTAGNHGTGDLDDPVYWNDLVTFVDQALERKAKREQVQPAPAEKQQKRPRLHDETHGVGAEKPMDTGVGLAGSLSREPRVLEARDQNGSGASKDESTLRDRSNSKRAPSGGHLAGSEALEQQQLASKQTVSERALPNQFSDSDDSMGEVTSPKRQQRAKSVGALRILKTNAPKAAFKMPPTKGARQVQAAKLRKSLPAAGKQYEEENLLLGGLHRISVEEEGSGFELPPMGVKASRSKSAERSATLPRGEKGRWMAAKEERAEQKKESAGRLVQTRILHPPVRKDPPFLVGRPSNGPLFGGGKWREASREDSDFLSTPREKALKARGREASESGRAGQGGKERPSQKGKNSLARDLGTFPTERKSKREEKVTPLDSVDDHVSDSEKENSQPEENVETNGDANGARPLEGEEVTVGREQACAVPGENAAALPVNRGIQVIKPGTYNRTAAERGRQLVSEEVPSHKYNAVVRKKDEREQLHAVECANCKAFYDAVVDHDAAAMEANLHNTCQHHLDNAGRHRFQYVPPATPSGFWDIGFDSPTQAAS